MFMCNSFFLFVMNNFFLLLSDHEGQNSPFLFFILVHEVNSPLSNSTILFLLSSLPLLDCRYEPSDVLATIDFPVPFSSISL